LADSTQIADKLMYVVLEYAPYHEETYVNPPPDHRET